jgi:tyrosine-protein kinase Etk/Wzc
VSEQPDFDPFVVVARRWRVIVVGGVLAAICAGLWAYLIVADSYAAMLTVVPSQRAQDSLAMSVAAKLPGAFDASQADVLRIQAVLTSNSVSDEVIEKFKLQERYGAAHLEHARTALWQHCSTTVDRRSAVLSLTCEDKDPKEAMDIAAYFGDVGNKVFGRVSVSSAREERTFLEQQVGKARHDVDEASRKLREFQEEHKVVDLPEQTKAVISAMAQLKGEMLSKQLELSYLSGFSSRGEASVVQLQQQISIMESKLKQLEASQGAAAAPSAGSAAGSAESFFPNAMMVPELRFELEQLLREQKIQETVFSLMTQRYEMAKIDEARDTSTFQILDHPTLPTFPSHPHRKKIVAVGLLGGLVLSAAGVLLPAWWRRRVGANLPT